MKFSILPRFLAFILLSSFIGCATTQSSQVESSNQANQDYQTNNSNRTFWSPYQDLNWSEIG
ncbi:MAG: hypothetical protein WD267_11885, partial [Balneolales bacterium]